VISIDKLNLKKTFLVFLFMPILYFNLVHVAYAEPSSVKEKIEPISASKGDEEDQAKTESTSESDKPTGEAPESEEKKPEDFEEERRRLLRELDPGLAPGVIIETPLGPKRYRFELGMFSRFESDVFVDEEEEEGDEFRTTPSLEFEVDIIKKEESVLTGKTRFEYNIVSNTGNDENYFEFKTGLEYEFGDNGIEIEYEIAPDQFNTISDGNEIRETEQDFRATYARSLTRKLSFRTKYELEYENHTIENERNNYEHEFGGDVRYKFNDLLNPGIGLEIELRNSNRSNDERWGWAPFLLLNSKINDRVWSRFRYLYGSRNYTTEDIDDGNFDRGDTRNEIRDNISIKLTRKWWINIFAEYRQLDSSREGRDTNKIEIGMGIFYRFP
jgi:hypothetical protein